MQNHQNACVLPPFGIRALCPHHLLHRSLRTDPTTRPRLGGHFKPFVPEFGEVLIELGAVTGSNGIARNTPLRETSIVHSWGHSRGTVTSVFSRSFTAHE